MAPLLRRLCRRHKVVGILGMHRSGTSWLAGSLEELGLYLGLVNTCSADNERGNREHHEVNNLHDQVLSDNGGTWRKPHWPNAWSDDKKAFLKAYIKNMDRTSSLWGFKDPRALLVLDEWQVQLPKMVRVGIYRHPLKVFKSLHARQSDFTEDEAMDLWRTYNQRLIEEYEREPFPVMRFDVDQERLLKGLTIFRDYIGIPSGRPLDGFFEASLIHHGSQADAVPASVKSVWEKLEEIAVNVDLGVYAAGSQRLDVKPEASYVGHVRSVEAVKA